jgi:sugar lactone lactonase YvrE
MHSHSSLGAPHSGSGTAKQVVLEEVGQSPRQWTGIAVLPGPKIFVNFPRWSGDVGVSVAELLPYGSVRPFPNWSWNEWNGGAQGLASRFVCVQSVVADKDGYHLWVLDSGNPCFTGVIPGAARLLKFDTRKGQLVLEIPYKKPDICHHSYLNDVRIDTTHDMAYLTDSEEGAIIVTPLGGGNSRRLLDGDPSVESEGIDVVIDGVPWRPKPCGVRRRVHADGIALSPDDTTLYFHALTGRTLYEVATADLRNPTLTPAQLGGKVQPVADTGPADGMECAPDGTLYLTSLEDHAVKRWSPGGTVDIAVQDHCLQWPDSLAVVPDGDGTIYIYVTTSRIHLGTGPYSVFRFKPF